MDTRRVLYSQSISLCYGLSLVGDISVNIMTCLIGLVSRPATVPTSKVIDAGMMFWRRLGPRAPSLFRKVKVVAMVVAVVLAGTLVGALWCHLHDNLRLQAALDRWPGFGPERGVYNFTVVTALFDIGRGGWLTFNRSYNTYLIYLFQLLKLDVNIVIFIEPQGVDFVRSARKGREHRTLIVETRLDDLPYYQDLNCMQEILNSEEYRVNNQLWKHRKPESYVALYDVVTNSKATLMERAVLLDPFRTPYFLWLDAGLTHGNASLLPADGAWHPRRLLSRPDVVTFTALRDLEALRRDAWGLYKLDLVAIAGGVFGGGRAAMLRYCAAHHRMWRKMLRNGIVDDDQTTFTLVYFNDTANFNPVLGDWYDLLRPGT